MKITRNDTTNLLWTGGWDSTFRLLELVLENKRCVQPYYLLDLNRRSTIKELITMRDIKQYLFLNYPKIENLILPTYYKEVSEIEPDSQISQAYHSIRKEKNIGSQFPWIARFCKEQGINDMELCAGLSPGTGSASLFGPFSEKVTINSEVVYRVKEEHFNQPEGIIFKYFSFPLYDKYNKKLLQNVAESKGWSSIMLKTWFCHTPLFGRIPCGICAPCTYAFNGDMGWRFPFYLRFLNKIKVLNLFRFIRKKIIDYINR